MLVGGGGGGEKIGARTRLHGVSRWLSRSLSLISVETDILFIRLWMLEILPTSRRRRRILHVGTTVLATGSLKNSVSYEGVSCCCVVTVTPALLFVVSVYR